MTRYGYCVRCGGVLAEAEDMKPAKRWVALRCSKCGMRAATVEGEA